MNQGDAMDVMLLKTVKAGGTYHSPGSVLSVDTDEAKRLVKLGVAEYIQERSEEGPEENVNEAEAENGGLDEGDEADALKELLQVDGMKKEFAEALIEKGIDTISQLQSMNADGLKALSIKGLGRRTAETIIEDASQFTDEG